MDIFILASHNKTHKYLYWQAIIKLEHIYIGI